MMQLVKFRLNIIRNDKYQIITIRSTTFKQTQNPTCQTKRPRSIIHLSKNAIVINKKKFTKFEYTKIQASRNNKLKFSKFINFYY